METATHIIKNFDQLSASNLRRQALLIAEAGFAAIDTARAVRKNFAYHRGSNSLRIFKQKFDLGKFKKIVVVGFGKAALEAVTEIQNILKEKITCGFVIDLKQGSLGNIVCRVGTHPHPTLVNVKATKELVAMLETCEEDDLVICAVSGGGSALLCYPHDMSCEAETSIISALTVKGANILELNTVRKHISSVKGGNLAKIIYPATCVSLIFSDVPGDNFSTVASGPTALDTTTAGQAAAILKKYDVLDMCQMPSCRLLETPKDKKYFEKVHNLLLVSPKVLLMGMKEEAENLGWSVKIFSERFEGLAREIGPVIAEANADKQCLLGTGESTVKIIGKGRGGRCQELALSALPSIAENQVLLSAASDGHDNTESAGAIADLWTKKQAENLGLKPEEFLNNNDSFNFFAETGGQILTGRTGANVSDFFVCLNE